MVEIHQRVKTPFGSGIVIGTSGDQVLIEYDNRIIKWEYRNDVMVIRMTT